MSGELSCSCKLSGLKRECWGQYCLPKRDEIPKTSLSVTLTWWRVRVMFIPRLS